MAKPLGNTLDSETVESSVRIQKQEERAALTMENETSQKTSCNPQTTELDMRLLNNHNSISGYGQFAFKFSKQIDANPILLTGMYDLRYMKSFTGDNGIYCCYEPPSEHERKNLSLDMKSPDYFEGACAVLSAVLDRNIPKNHILNPMWIQINISANKYQKHLLLYFYPSEKKTVDYNPKTSTDFNAMEELKSCIVPMEKLMLTV